LLVALLVAAESAGCWPRQAPVALPAFDAAQADPNVSDLQEQAAAVDDLSWLLRRPRQGGQLALPEGRAALLAEKHRLEAARDARGVARLNAVLAGEAFARASRPVERWLAWRDGKSGLFPREPRADRRVWVYADTGADLFGHLALGAYLLAPERYPDLLNALEAERRLEPRLPDDVDLVTGQPLGLPLVERTFGVAEYVKDGLLPLIERSGPEPWLGRSVELVDAILAEAAVPTRRGPIPADSTEVNGDLLQVLARLGWATGEPRYHEAAERIALAYLDVFPTTRYLPPNRWDFMENEPLDRRRFRLSDHGNEVFSGLIEWHLAETLRGAPGATEHRQALRRLLDRLLETGRGPDGLWFRVVEIPSGKVEQEGLTDNWGYLLQAYLTAALIEEQAPDGDPERARVYRAAAQQALAAVPNYRFYDWQRGEMDGYADTVESALYLLNRLEAPAAAAWVDDQMPVLYGFQAADGAVLDAYLDGNFIRTSLLYGLSQSAGLVPRPWREGLLVGAAAEGACLAVAAASVEPWSGRLAFDTPRHRLHLGLPLNYPRLNEWPEWFVVEPERNYRVLDQTSGLETRHSGQQLSAGLSLSLPAGGEHHLQVCPD
jgi:hypothetical protein